MNTISAINWTDNMVGSLWMIAAMAVFSIEDAFIKSAAKMLPIGEVLVLFGMGGMLIFAGILRLNREPLFVVDVVSYPMLIRLVFEIIGRLFYVLAIALIPLSAATVILQATPLVVIAGAVLIFGERVGWRRWTAIVIGLTGVIVIIQPGTESFSGLSLLAVIGTIGFAGRDLASRAAPASIGTSLLGFYGFLSIIVAGTVYTLWVGESFVVPRMEAFFAIFCAATTGVIAYSFLMIAMRTGEISAVTPFRYTRLVFGVMLGVFIFGEVVSLSMIIGSTLIVLSGIFIGLWSK
jgi:drug/metabolite transporter (DMT)-like permease